MTGQSERRTQKETTFKFENQTMEQAERKIKRRNA